MNAVLTLGDMVDPLNYQLLCAYLTYVIIYLAKLLTVNEVFMSYCTNITNNRHHFATSVFASSQVCHAHVAKPF